MQTPSHYEGEVQPWDIIAHLKLGYNLGCVVKYAFRAGKKEGNSVEQDLNKAIAYLQEEMERPNQYVFTLHSIEYTDNWKWIHSLNLGNELESVLQDIVGYLYCNATPPLNECIQYLKEHLQKSTETPTTKD
jgi:hypothetical protein